MCTCAGFLSGSHAAIRPARFDVSRAVRALGLASAPAPPHSDLVLEPVTVVNPGASRIDGARVVVGDGRIVSIESSATDPAGKPRHFLLPGLVDLHTHAFPGMADWFGRLELMHGVTSVRNAAADESIFAYREAVARGERVAPRIFACGMPLDGKPAAFPPPFSGAVLATPERGRRRVSRLAAKGANHVKTFINLTPPVLEAICDEAARHGLPALATSPASLASKTAGSPTSST